MAKKLSSYQKILENQENLKMAKNKLPVNVKKLRGTYRKSREILNKPLTRAIPEKPAFMTRGGGEYWNMIIDRLIKIGSIDVVDDLSIMILAESLATFMRTSKFLEENGDTYTFENSKGEIVKRVRPELKIQNDCWTRIFQLFKEFGLTFKSRINITPTPLEQTPNPWANLRK